jgi:hypothetical protein
VKELLGTHRIGGWVGCRGGLDALEKKISELLPGLEPPIIQPVDQRCIVASKVHVTIKMAEFERIIKKSAWCIIFQTVF